MTEPHSFYIENLALVGAEVPTAEVSFTDGLNIVEGASDTGKSYILAAIEWCLGATAQPKDISEAEGYESAILTIRVRETGLVWTLRRSLTGGSIIAERPSEEPGRSSISLRLAPKHSAKNESNVSTFLLRLCGSDGKRIRKNASGETENLTFPTLRKLAFIDEQRIIASGSPFSTGQRGDETKFRSTLRFLLTGVDDSSIVAKERTEIVRARTGGRAEAIDEVLASLTAEMAALGPLPASTRDAIHTVLEEIAVIQSELSTAASALNAIQEERGTRLGRLRTTQARQAQVKGLIERFQVLSMHYDSDLERMHSSVEAAVLLGSFPEGPCVLCGAAPEHAAIQADPIPDFVEACTAEERKLQRLKRDLVETIEELYREERELSTVIRTETAELREIDARLETQLRPVQRSLQVSLLALLERRANIERHASFAEQISRLEALRTEAASTGASSPDEKSDFAPHAPAYALDELAKEIEVHLREWQFSEGCRVHFDPTSDDVVIDGKPRGSYGKGYRAVAHAACTIALMTIARKKGRVHPGLVVLDSPLNPYRGAIDDEGQLSGEVKQAFLKQLETSLGDRQVILLENELPDVAATARRIEFTKSHRHGRYGLFPVGR